MKTPIPVDPGKPSSASVRASTIPGAAMIVPAIAFFHMLPRERSVAPTRPVRYPTPSCGAA